MSTGARMRVYEIAREMGLPNKELIAKIRALGLEVNNHMSTLDGDDIARVRRSLEKERIDNTVTQRLSKTVLRRRSKASREAEAAEAEALAGEELARPAATNGASTRRRPAADAGEAPPIAAAETPRVARPQAAEAPAADERVADESKAARTPSPAATEESAAPQAPSEARSASAEERESTAESKAAEPTATTAVQAERQPPTSPAIIAGPKSVNIPGRKSPPPPPPPRREIPTQSETLLVRSAEGGTVPPVEESRVRHSGPSTLEEVADSAQARFQAELERARKQAAEREKQRDDEAQKKRDEDLPPAGTRPAGRPEVGTVIDLPSARIKITERPAGRGAAGPGQLRGRFAQQQTRGRRGRDVRKKKLQRGQGKQTQITTPAEHKRVIRIEETTTVADLGKSMGIKAQELLKKLWQMGMVGVTLNAQIDFETANLLASEFGYEVQNVAFKEADVFETTSDVETDLLSRAPVVTVMGHVDHGKTSLLDYIRKAKVASGEAGGITQHIGAYRVDAGENYGDIVFLDTPGHAAFTEMRARGAQATDLVVLVCAADDGVMPQTKEAIEHAKAAKVPIIVAVNKSDLPHANPDRVRQQCADFGLIPEEWGGDTIYVDVSAHTGDGIDKLLESISVTSELLELRANPDKDALGVVIEAKLDRARGPMATVLIQEGTLRVGDIVVIGECMGKIRAMLSDTGENVDEATPSTPVELLGIDGVPNAGETLHATDDEKMAKQVVENRRQQKRKKELASTSKVSLDNLMERIQQGGEQEELKIVLKADVQGSAEALKEALIKQSTAKVAVNVISAGVGGVTETDVNLAKAGGGIIVGFHVRPAGKAAKIAEQEGVEIKIYDIIYEAIDDVRLAMAGLLAPIKREVGQGKAEVRDTFTIPRRGVVAGCMVTDGRITRKSLLRVVRESVQLFEGRVGSLRRFKDEASEVKEGYECGVMVDGFNDLRVGDIIESYEIVEEAATL